MKISNSVSKFIHILKNYFWLTVRKPGLKTASARKNNRDKWSKVENELDSREASHLLLAAKQFYILVNNDGCIKRKIAQHTVAKSQFLFKNQVLNNPIFGGKIQIQCWSRFHQNWIFGQKLRFCISVQHKCSYNSDISRGSFFPFFRISGTHQRNALSELRKRPILSLPRLRFPPKIVLTKKIEIKQTDSVSKSPEMSQNNSNLKHKKCKNLNFPHFFGLLFTCQKVREFANWQINIRPKKCGKFKLLKFCLLV